MSNAPVDPESARAAALATELRTLIGAFTRRLRDQTDRHDLTPSQTSVILRLERDGPATTTALARAEGMRPQSMGAIVSALQAAGVVAGAPDPADGRQTILSLTDSFREFLKTSRAARQDFLLVQLQTRLTAEEQEQLAASLELLKRLIAP
jgi:DNA-binding MarR family transcriptional regulator